MSNVIILKTHISNEKFIQNYNSLKETYDKDKIFVVSSCPISFNENYYIINSGKNKLPNTGKNYDHYPYYWWNNHYGILDFIYNHQINYDYIWNVEWDLYCPGWDSFIDLQNKNKEDFLASSLGAKNEKSYEKIKHLHIKDETNKPILDPQWSFFQERFDNNLFEFEFHSLFELSRFSRNYAEFLLDRTILGMKGFCEYIAPSCAINNDFSVGLINRKQDFIKQNGLR
jgi:hypothetical protein